MKFAEASQKELKSPYTDVKTVGEVKGSILEGIEMAEEKVELREDEAW